MKLTLILVALIAGLTLSSTIRIGDGDDVLNLATFIVEDSSESPTPDLDPGPSVLDPGPSVLDPGPSVFLTDLVLEEDSSEKRA